MSHYSKAMMMVAFYSGMLSVDSRVHSNPVDGRLRYECGITTFKELKVEYDKVQDKTSVLSRSLRELVVNNYERLK